MSKRRSGAEVFLDELFDFLRTAPWWVGPPVIAITYALFAWVGPYLISKLTVSSGDVEVPVGSGFSQVIVMIAPWATFFVAAIWLAALIAKQFDAKRLDRQEGIATIRELPWREFEQLMAEAFRRQGYRVTDTGSGADGGIDLILRREGLVTFVQCKQWKQRRVGVKLVRQFYGVVASKGVNCGIFVTSGGYTAEAERFAEKLPMDLIDGEKLEVMIRGVQSKRSVVDGPSTTPPHQPEATASPECPQCGDGMVQRVARRGARKGQPFWGCPNFPKCRGTRPLDH